MGEERLVPKLRFNGFDDEWTWNYLMDLSDISTGNKDLKDNIENGKYPFFVRSANVERINSYSYDGEAVLIPGDGVNVGKIYHYIKGKFDYHQRVYKISDFNNVILGKYVYYYLSEKFLRQVHKNSQKASVDSLRLPTIQKMKINYPSNLKEQNKIISLLSTVDIKINLLEKKYQSYKYFKKYLMQKIFAQELRFDDNCQYKTKKVKDFLTESKIEGTDDINKRLTVKLNLKGITIRESKTIEKEGATKQFIRKSGQFIYGKQNLHKGAFGIVPKELGGYLSSSDIPSFDFKGDIEPKWFYYYFSRKSFYERLESLSTGTGSKRISPKEFLNIKIIVPEIKEQHRIVCLFAKIDEEIMGISNQILQMNRFKKSLLQQMFV